MIKYVIVRNITVYDSITKEKHVKTMYFHYIDNDTDDVHWTSNKNEAKQFDQESAVCLSYELDASFKEFGKE